MPYGQQGEGAFDLIFYPGDDPEAAARSAYAGWASVLGRLPGDGRYSAGLAMIETENGYYILIQNTVTQPAREPQDDEPEKPEEPEAPYTEDGKGNYTVNTTEGLKKLFSEDAGDFAGKIITLKAGATFTVDKLADKFGGTLTSDASNKATIEITDVTQGLFNEIEGSGTVENLKINVKGSISGTENTGVVTGGNYGNIIGCDINISGSVSAIGPNDKEICVGGVAGCNDIRGNISNCTVTISGSISASSDNKAAYAGGVAGINVSAGISGCTVRIENSGSISSASSSDNKPAYAGGVVGSNQTGMVDGNCNCTLNDNGKIKATAGTNNATVPSEDKDGIDQEGSKAYAGTKIGYDDDINISGPVACTTTTPAA